MNKEIIFKNSSLYKIEFINQGRDLVLFFTDTYIGTDLGCIYCLGIEQFIIKINKFIDYTDDNDSLFPLFIPEIYQMTTDEFYELIIDVGIFIKIKARNLKINFK